MKTTQGKLIVIDGSDGSGKSTQTQLLVDYLTKVNSHTKHLKFPRYESFYGKVVAKYLRGEFGNLENTSPYLASMIYAQDRFFAKKEMKDFLKPPGFLVLDRYATSNMGHQGAKFKNDSERDEFLAWNYEMEYKINKLPKEDIVIYLYVPYIEAIKLRANITNKEYLKGKTTDIHEADTNHLVAAEKTYLFLANKYPHWVKIDCIENEKLLSIDAIHLKIIEKLKERKFI
ncbi:MAG: thymidylate kinase [bacterium]|nr:thymidylate kinase [bacterium]